MSEKVKDTLFIDMKYLILYRKLGFQEIKPDIYIYDYPDTRITIESENQRYNYKNCYHSLTNYRDFVILECIDRLLKKGYSSDSINIFDDEPHIIVNGDRIVLRIIAAQWGKDYDKLCRDYSFKNKDVVCLYTSQLSGGLVDYISKIFTKDGIYECGIFEKDIEPFHFKMSNRYDDISYPEDFHVVKNELVSYSGSKRIVTIPEGIKRIGAGAFWNNMVIEDVIIPESVTCICGDAFVYCENLKHANIPKAVDQIGDDPFAGCPDIIIDNNSPSYTIEDGVLFDKSMKTLIHYSASKKNDYYKVPETVEWIGKHSFYKCSNLKSVHITNNVKFMGNNAFSDCKDITLINDSPYFHYINGVLYNKDRTTCMHYSMGSGIERVFLEPSVRIIGRNCFWNCDMISDIVIPQSVRQIGYNPFANCKKLTIENHSPFYKIIDGILYDSSVKELICCSSAAAKNGVDIPDTVVNIGRNAFTGCESLEQITIPRNVKFISRSAFSGCTNLKKILIPETVEDLGDWCFNNCKSMCVAYIPKKLTIKQNTFNGCSAKIVRT